MLSRPLLIGSEIYRNSSYGRQHPLSIPRVSTTIDLVRALGWLPDPVYMESPRATLAELARFHAPEYVEALRRAEAEQRVEQAVSIRYNIGRNGNPIYREMFARPATACGATLKAVELLRHGGVVYSPAGGTHHGRSDRASGFCYFNDPVLGILRALDEGMGRVYYVDLDAHHCDGVEDALAGDSRVLIASVHERERWPFTGLASRGNVVNLPVPAEFSDNELGFLVDNVLVPLGYDFAPDLLVVQCGADALAEDPLSRLALSNTALWHAVRALLRVAPRVLVLGGGGYNPWSVARCWAGVWAALNGLEVPDVLPAGAEAVLRGLSWSRSAGRNPPPHWFTTLADTPRPGPVRAAVRELASFRVCADV